MLGSIKDYVYYEYGANGWGDVLIDNGVIEVYSDELGNITSDTYGEYTWRHGRELATMTRYSTSGPVNWTMTYDADGLRTKRTDGTNTYSYSYIDGQLWYMKAGNQELFISWDAAGNPWTLQTGGQTYYYVTNLQGDVVAILNGSGDPMVTYTYDAWGNILEIGGEDANTLGRMNPLRYRGYVYDQETGLYYLQSRYYDPEMGRFISADSIIGVDDMYGNNLFAYCDNNPVCKVDYSGEDGQTFGLGMGWYYRIDPPNTTTGTKRHIHIWNNKKEYIQNDDGSPHDKSKGEKGKIPKWLNNMLIKNAGWDYNGNRKSFFEETSCKYWVEGTHYTFADKTTAFKGYSPYQPIHYDSVDFYEGIYFQDNVTSSGNSKTTQAFYLPIIGPVPIPSFTFNWGFLPIPLFC